MGKLTVKKVESAKPGRHSDGGGLMLLVKPTGGKSWVLRVQMAGKRRDIGLGSVSNYEGQPAICEEIPLLDKRILTLAEARLKAATLRHFAKAGHDPIMELRKDRSAVPSFADAMRHTFESKKPEWSDKTAVAFMSSLELHAIPKLGAFPVNEIDAQIIAETLRPIWMETPMIARKVRQRIGLILNYAQAQRWRDNAMPSAAVSVLLPTQAEGGNFDAMDYRQVPAFLIELGQNESIGRLALKFLVLTAARSGEVRGAQWSQIDFNNKLWHRPAILMKGRNARGHTVTLNDQALEVLQLAARMRCGANDLIFPNRSGKILSDMSLSGFLSKVDATPHGFRSSFRDWAAERMPEIPDAVAEAALAHRVADKVVSAYRRTNFLELRKILLDAWGHYCASQPVDADLAKSTQLQAESPVKYAAD